MPAYDYKCDDCVKTIEIIQSITEDTLTECPTCNGSIKRLISRNVGISFKGSGFYVTDSQKTTPSEKKK